MELPHSGTVLRLRNVRLDECERALACLLERDRRTPRSRRGGRTSCASRATTSSIAASASGGWCTTRSRPSPTTVELVVGDDRGDLDDDVTTRVEPGHLEVHPDEHGGTIDSPRGRGARSFASTPTCRSRRMHTWAMPGPTCRPRDVTIAGPGGRALVPTGRHRHPGGLRRLRAAPQRARL